jgi:hypothetical protein
VIVQYLWKILLAYSLFLTVGCEQINSKKQMKWISADTIYGDFPLYLRRPDYENIWKYKSKFSKLYCITHNLDMVKSNGLPESDYNRTLLDFDQKLVSLFNPEMEGIVILVETYAGKRNYWYYVSSEIDPNLKYASLSEEYPLNRIESSVQSDKNWGFLIEYPIVLYK